MNTAQAPALDPVALAGKLIQIRSADPPGHEIEVAQLVHSTMQMLGLESTLDEFSPGRANVIGRLRGTGNKPSLVFSAHLDTVPPGDQPWSFDPFSGDVVAGRLRGRGASDMKCAVAAFIAAAQRVQTCGAALAGDLILAFTAGESANCLGARRLVKQGFQREIGAFLCGEPSSLDLVVAEPAVLWLTARAKGAIGHVSGAAGVNAITLMTAFLHRLDGLQIDLPTHPLLGPPTLNVGTIQGGSAINVTPDLCLAGLDIRFGPGTSPEQATRQIAPYLPEGVTFEVSDFKPAVVEDPDNPFVRCAATALQQRTGRDPSIGGVSYYSDAAILLDGLDVPFVILGPGDLGMSGQPDESASAERIHQVVDVYADIARDWLR